MDRPAEIDVSKSKSTNYQRLLVELASKVKLMLQATKNDNRQLKFFNKGDR